MKKLAFILFTGLFAFACNYNVPPQEIITWVEQPDKGCKVKREMGEFTFILQYKPTDYIIAYELLNEAIQKGEVQSRKKELANYMHFNLTIQAISGNALKYGTDPNGYFDRINYFLEGANEDFYLVTQSDTFICGLAHLEQTYGLANESTVVLGFEVPSNNIKDDVFLVYDDRVFGVGTVKFKIPEKAFQQLPQLTLKY